MSNGSTGIVTIVCVAMFALAAISDLPSTGKATIMAVAIGIGLLNYAAEKMKNN